MVFIPQNWGLMTLLFLWFYTLKLGSYGPANFMVFYIPLKFCFYTLNFAQYDPLFIYFSFTTLYISTINCGPETEQGRTSSNRTSVLFGFRYQWIEILLISEIVQYFVLSINTRMKREEYTLRIKL